jgi:hypothetical protein
VQAEGPEGEELIGRLLATSLKVANVEAAYQTLTDRGVSFLPPPEKQAWAAPSPSRSIRTRTSSRWLASN